LDVEFELLVAPAELVDWAPEFEDEDCCVTDDEACVTLELRVAVTDTEDDCVVELEARTTNLSPTSESPAASVIFMKNVPPTVALFPGVQAYEFEAIEPIT